MTRTAMEKKSKILKKKKCLGNVLTYILYVLRVDLEQLFFPIGCTRIFTYVHVYFHMYMYIF